MKRLILILTILTLLVPLTAGPIEDIINTAADLVGTPYRYGGVSSSGFDCSGLLYYLYSGVVSPFPRTSGDQARAGSYVDQKELLPGDLVFYATGSSRTQVTHAAVYVGNNAVIQAVSAGPQTGVVVTDMDERYWRNRYVTSRRVLSHVGPAPQPAPSPDPGPSPDPRKEELVPVTKERVIDDKGKEKTVVTIGRRKFTLSSWEEWFAKEQADFKNSIESDKKGVEEDLSDFEKWKRANSPD
jgi:hypothetical protein